MFAFALAALVGLPTAFYALFLLSAWKPGLLRTLLALLAVAGALFAYVFANQSPDMFLLFFVSGFVLWAGLVGLAARSAIAWLRRRNPARTAPAAILVGGLFFFVAVWPVSRFVLPW